MSKTAAYAKKSEAKGEFHGAPKAPSQSGKIQAKLTVGQPDDIYEQEADRLADRVMRMTDESLVQRQTGCPGCEEEEELVQAKSTSPRTPQVTPALESDISSLKGGGQLLSESTRSFFEPRFGTDFSHVRVHTGDRAAQTAQSINAEAYTTGSNIVFNQGQYSPGSTSGKRLLAHELTHVIQQGNLHKNEVSTHIQRIPRNPGEVPFEGEIIAWSTRIYSQANTPQNPNDIIADLPRGHRVTILGGNGWIRVRTLVDGSVVFGYISHEQIRRIESQEQAEKDSPPSDTSTISEPPNLFKNCLIERYPDEPERIYIQGPGVTPELIAEELYGDRNCATRMWAIWDEEAMGPFLTTSELRVGMWVQIDYYLLTPIYQKEYNRSISITSRASWNARSPITDDPTRSYEAYNGPLEDILDSIVIHHSGNQGYRTMREVQDRHMDSDDPRADIGYHFGIDLDGKVYQGRAINIKGSHVAGANTGKIGIVLLADLDTQDEGLGPIESIMEVSDDSITTQMESSLLRLIHYLIGKYPRIRYLGGHREFDSRRFCPGDLAMERMSSWRSSTNLNAPPN